MKVALLISTEVTTRVVVDIPVNPKGRVGNQIEDYIEKHTYDIARDAYPRLKNNFISDWSENIFIKTDDECPVLNEE